MQFQYTPYVLPLLIAAIISGWISFYAFQRRNTPGAGALTSLSLAITQWLVCYALEIAGADLATKLFWGKLQYAAITSIPVIWFILATYLAARREAFPWRTQALLFMIPTLTLVLALTNDWHGLIWKETQIRQTGAFSALEVSYGPWFWIHSAYSYIFLLLGTIINLRKVLRGQQLYRRQAAALTAAVLAPWAGNIIYLAGLSPIPGLDLTPFAFALTCIAMALAVFGFRVIDLLPVARDLVVEEMNEGMLVIDANNRIADINGTAERMFHVTAAEMVGRPVAEALSRWPHLVERYKNVMEAVDEIRVGEGDSTGWYELSLAPLYDRRKRLIGRVIIIRDISIRRQAEEQVRRLSRAVESSPASIVITDASGNIQYANPKFAQVTGYSLDEVLGQNPRLLKTGETPPEVYRQLWETISAGKEWRGEFCNRKKNGEQFWESASISPITDHTGQIVSYVAVKEDITEQRRMQQHLQRQQEALKSAHDQAVEASQLKTQLLAKVNHELRTPLGGILGYAELLHSGIFGKLTDQQKQAAARIIESSHYLHALINELLDAAQIESRRLNLRLAACSPADILHKVETAMCVLADKKGIRLISSVDKSLPATIVSDEQRLQQVMINLVGNAIKYTQDGEVSICLTRCDPRRWQITVTDTGIGISTETMPHIFEPFRQGENEITSENRGAGLGLAITHQLVNLMGGDIQVESRVGEGSRFTVTLPLDSVPQAEEMPC